MSYYYLIGYTDKLLIEHNINSMILLAHKNEVF